MATLYELTERYVSAFNAVHLNEETGEIEGWESFEHIAGSFKDKTEAVACYIKNLDADCKALQDEIKTLKSRLQTKQNKSEWMRNYLQHNMEDVGMSEFETPKCRVGFTSSYKVDVYDISIVPKEFIRTKTEESVDKNAVKDLLKAGADVPGCELLKNRNMTIR